MAKPKKPAKKKKPAPKKKTMKKAAPAKKKIASVDAYVSSLPSPMQTIINRVRALVASAAPEAIEAFKWGQPVYESNGPFAYLKAHKSHVNFGFWRGAQLEAPEGALEGDGDRMRHIKLPTPEAINEGLVTTLVRQAVMLNSRLGTPTAIRGR